jgi:hypothetical protein
MLVAVAINPDGPTDQDRCGRDLYAPAPMPGRDRNRDDRKGSALVYLPQEANDVKDVLEELLLVVQRTRHYPGS